MREGEEIRKFGVTNMNDHSSRSHTIFRIIIESCMKVEGKKGIFFDSEESLKSYLINNITSKDVILIKGSRGMKMERFINV